MRWFGPGRSELRFGWLSDYRGRKDGRNSVLGANGRNDRVGKMEREIPIELRVEVALEEFEMAFGDVVVNRRHGREERFLV